jgi:hypothetical protein
MSGRTARRAARSGRMSGRTARRAERSGRMSGRTARRAARSGQLMNRRRWVELLASRRNTEGIGAQGEQCFVAVVASCEDQGSVAGAKRV